MLGNMQFKPASEQNRHHFAAWSQPSSIKERTCRPVVNGKRVPPSDKVITWAFFVDSVKEPVGRFVYFDVNPRNQSAEFGYIINPHFRSQGIGIKMVSLAMDALFANTDLNKLYCQTAAFNVPSIKLLERLEFHRDGILREHHELKGQLWNDYIYSVLRRDWLSKQESTRH